MFSHVTRRSVTVPARIQPPETFDFSTPNEWPKWRKRFERYLVVSGKKKKEEADKIDLFMYLMGDRADDIFRTFKFEKEEEATKIDSVLKAFDSHFCVRKNIIYERAKFNSRIQEDREPVDEFITSLYKLADSCEFEGLHEQLIRDRIVVGVRDKALSERMQLDNELTLEKAVKLVRQQEAVRQQQVDLQRPSTSQKVSAVEDSSNLDDDEGECRRRWIAEIQVNGKQVKFKLDSQADVTCVPLCLFKKVIGQQRLVECDINIRAAEFSELQTVAQQEDTTLKAVVNYLEQGRPDKKKMSQALLSYWHVKDELGVQNGLLMRSCRLVIPASMKLEILDKLHAGHFGITKTRLRARETVWWPGISEEIAETVRRCSVCIQEAVSKHEPLIPTNFPTRPWQKIGMDLFKFENKWYLVVIDYYSRFPEMIQLDRLTANVVVRSCKSIFARHGIPETVVSDNGTQFGAAREFSNFARQYGFTHVTSSPRFSQSNGMAEAGVKIAKLILKKNQDPSLGLLEYRSTPLENGYSPAELLMGHKLRTTLPIAPDNLNPKLVDSQTLKRKEGRRRKDMKSRYDRRCGATEMEELSEGDTVWITDMRIWGIVKKKASTPRSYMVDTPVGTLRRNRFHLRKGDTVQYPADPSTPTFSGEELVENEKTPVVDYPSNDSEEGQIRTRIESSNANRVDSSVRSNVNSSTRINSVIQTHSINHSSSSSQILLSTALIRVNNLYGNSCMARALVDTGSQRTLITDSLIKTLNLPVNYSDASMYGIGDNCLERPLGEVNITFSPHYSNMLFTAKALILNKITCYLPNFVMERSRWPHLVGLRLADPTFDKPAPNDIIIGADIAPSLYTGQVRFQNERGPTALGWLFSSKIMAQQSDGSLHHSVLTFCATSIDNQLRKFWELDSIPPCTQPILTKEEMDCEQHFKTNVLRTTTGRCQSTTTNLRVVFDASACSDDSLSLNKVLHIGPKLQTDIFDLLLRFRTFFVALSADIEEMYRQILIHPDDSDYQRVLWRDSPSDAIQEYKLTTITYGTSCAPYLAIRTLHQLADDEAMNYPVASEIVKRDFYVDGLLTGADTVEEAQVLIRQIIALLAEGGFLIRKWVSNSPKILDFLPGDQNGINQSFDFKDLPSVKLLRILWDPSLDPFTLRVKPPDIQ
ncbi:K02A2.6-like, partial [Cordylochernes scorpioides]